MNTQAINRKQFLRGQFKGEQPLRPPWALDEYLFTDICERCGDCISVCHAGIIQSGSGGFPEMNFTDSGCDYCGDCADRCKPQALIRHNQASPFPSQQKVSIDHSHCFTERGIVCRSCGEVCEYEAIGFKPATGGVSHLQLNTELCDGCGECVHVCPASIIQIKKSSHGERQ